MFFWYACITHDKVLDYESKLQLYIDASAAYIIASETCPQSHVDTSGQHIHIACEISEVNLKLFVDNIHRKYFKLRGRARGGLGRQYGVIHSENVKNKTRFLIYTCKDKNVIFRNITGEKIKEYMDLSFEKETYQNRFQLLMKHLLDNNNYLLTEGGTALLNLPQIQLDIVKHHIKHPNNKTLSRSQVKSYTLLFITNYIPYPERYFIDIYSFIMN